jgi:5-methylcytosine-specific restriction endonuclease McrA
MIARESSRVWHAQHPERNREAQRRWYEKNKERERAKARAYRIANPEKRREAQRRWNEANPEKLKEFNRRLNPTKKARYRARLAGVEHEPWTRAQVWDRGRGVCHICSQSLDPDRWEADHVVPVSKGGRDALDNLLPAHPRCNRSKGAA